MLTTICNYSQLAAEFEELPGPYEKPTDLAGLKPTAMPFTGIFYVEHVSASLEWIIIIFFWIFKGRWKNRKSTSYRINGELFSTKILISFVHPKCTTNSSRNAPAKYFLFHHHSSKEASKRTTNLILTRMERKKFTCLVVCKMNDDGFIELDSCPTLFSLDKKNW